MDVASTIPLALVELCNALSRKVRENDISVGAARGLILKYVGAITLLDQNKYLVAAFDVAMKHNISLYDSLFIAVAIGEGCDLVSCDELQLKIASSLGVRTIKC